MAKAAGGWILKYDHHQTGTGYTMFEVGRIYNRRTEINGPYGGGLQSGISSSASHPLVFLFTGDSGEQHGYRDGWDSSGVFLYTGEGQIGDMEFARGNKAIRDHASDGKDLHLFQSVGKGKGYRYLGQFACADWEYRPGIDREGKPRKIIVFRLVEQSGANEQAFSTATGALQDLRQKALAAANTATKVEGDARQKYFERSAIIAAYVLARAAGTCEGCGEPAPFTRDDGRPYLEAHHIRRLSDGGLDHPFYVAGICPNCHRRAHHGSDRVLLNQRLKKVVEAKEAQLVADSPRYNW